MPNSTRPPVCAYGLRGAAFAPVALTLLLAACGGEGSKHVDGASEALSQSTRSSRLAAETVATTPDWRPSDKGGRPPSEGIFVRQAEDHQISGPFGHMSSFAWQIELQAGDEFSWRVVGGEGVASVCGWGFLRFNESSTVVYTPDDQAVTVSAAGTYWAHCSKKSQPLANDGVQVSAFVSRPSTGETFESRPATLTVNETWQPSEIIEPPLGQVLPAGQTATFAARAFSITVGEPRRVLLWQWYRDGVAIPGATGPVLTLPTTAAEAGANAIITARYNGDYERANGLPGAESEPAILTIAPLSTTVGAAGGGVPGPGGSSLGVPEGALTDDVSLSVTSQPVSADAVPAGTTALGDATAVEPMGITFTQPAELRIAVPQELSGDMAIAVVRLEDTAGSAMGAGTAKKLQSGTAAKGGAGRSGLTSAAVQCLSSFDVSNGIARKFVDKGGSYLAVAVPANECQFDPSIRPATAAAPSDTDRPCSRGQDFVDASLGGESTLVSRHVDCRKAVTQEQLTLDLWRKPDGSYALVTDVNSPPAGATATRPAYGTAQIESRLTIYGPSASGASKRAKLQVRMLSFTPSANYPSNAPRPTKLVLRPKIACEGNTGSEKSLSTKCSAGSPTLPLSLFGGSGGSVDFNIDFEWTKNPDRQLQPFDLETFEVSFQRLEYKFDGGTFDSLGAPGNQNWFRSELGLTPTLRCDRGVVSAGGRGVNKGCVFPAAAAVYRLAITDPSVTEAAQHIREAQDGVNLFPGMQSSPGKYIAKPGTRAIADDLAKGDQALHRTTSEAIRRANRNRSCEATDNLFQTRLPFNQSQSCRLNQQMCSCDEYPFASTWNGGGINEVRTSVKRISDAQNKAGGGGRLNGQFYLRERVLDLTLYPASSRQGGDDFWVYIE